MCAGAALHALLSDGIDVSLIFLGLFFALYEEIIYRGALMGSLARVWPVPRFAAVASQAFVFAAAHVLSRGGAGLTLLNAVGWFAIATFLGWLVRRAGGLFPAVAAHWVAASLGFCPALVGNTVVRGLLRSMGS